MNDRRQLWLDLLRGLSAIAVCSGHLRAMMFCDYGQIEKPSIFHAVLFAVTGMAHQAVIFFFVLSGYFVGGSVWKNRQRFSMSKYATQRLLRLWVVLLPALVATWLIDRYVASSAPDVLEGSRYEAWSSGPSPDGSYSTSPATFLGNALFLQTILVPVFGTNGPLWSLANEFWYYMLFPLLMIATRQLPNYRSPWWCAGAIVLSGAILYWLPREFLLGWVIWLLGVGSAIVADRLSPIG